MTQTTIKPPEFFQVTPEGELRYNFHQGQWQAWNDTKRFIVVLAGTQGGKTSFGPAWLLREIQDKGPGDYLVVTPTYKLLELKALPEFKYLFEELLDLGYYQAVTHTFYFSQKGNKQIHQGYTRDQGKTRIIFGYATDPDSLESATAKAAWLDEAGQNKFKLASWEAILRRLSLAQGRVLITTTPYNLGWLKQKLFDPWRKGLDPDISVIRFSSIMNPAFPRAEFERARRTLPRWKFNLFYRAVFSKPAGLIYDSFDEDLHVIPRFPIPLHWPRYLGVDFGGVHTCGMYYAKNPDTGIYYAYREYLEGGRTSEEHAKALQEGEPGPPFAVGGSFSEDQWRRDFKAGGLAIKKPDQNEVEIGIDRVYGVHKLGLLRVFDDLEHYLEEKFTYSRALDPAGEPTEKIEDKNTFHHMDAERYILGYLTRKGHKITSGSVDWYGEDPAPNQREGLPKVKQTVDNGLQSLLDNYSVEVD